MVSQKDPNKLTAKQSAFVEYYCNPGSETVNNAKQSAIKAGYSNTTADNGIMQILGNVGVCKAIEVYRANLKEITDLTIIEVLQDLAWGITEARVSKDLGALARLTELRGKYLSMWSADGNNAATGLNLNFSTATPAQNRAQIAVKGSDEPLKGRSPEKGDVPSDVKTA